MIKTDEDDEFERIEHENEMKSGQPYHFESKREWVGLTDEERDYFTYIDAKDKARFRKYFDYIEAKLKEKNT
jgi:hypothetical protein